MSVSRKTRGLGVAGKSQKEWKDKYLSYLERTCEALSSQTWGPLTLMLGKRQTMLILLFSCLRINSKTLLLFHQLGNFPSEIDFWDCNSFYISQTCAYLRHQATGSKLTYCDVSKVNSGWTRPRNPSQHVTATTYNYYLCQKTRAGINHRGYSSICSKKKPNLLFVPNASADITATIRVIF